MNKLILISIFLTIFVSSYNCDVSSLQREQLIDAHNNYRRDIALGKVAGQPSASNMMELKWNDEAAEKAQNYADQCIFQHDQSSARRFSNYRWVGQNIAYWSTDDVTEGVKMWFDEVNGYDFNTERCTEYTCLHYTALAWAETKEFGCGVADCSDYNLGNMFLICNYGPGGNWRNKKAYEVGEACERCPRGTRCDNGLCVE